AIGREKLVYYHQEIAILLATGLAAWAMGLPVLPCLDAAALGVGAFLACGRVGCLMVGCCHGRPHPWGVRYRPEHARAGMAAHWTGVRLFPVQLVESAWVAAAVVAGAAMVLRGAPPGAAFAWYVVAYDVGRFLFEFARGDTDRPYHAGFSQAQWLSLALTCGVGAAELGGWLPLAAWHVAAGPAIALAMAAVALRRRMDGGRHRLLHPRHLDELARLLAAAPAVGQGQGPVPVARTSLGVRLSSGAADGVRHHTLSRPGAALTPAEARALAGAVARLDGGAPEVVPGPPGIHHVIVRPAGAR
ncbi:MAG TPA: prolipoprotein diacylglyceryl transferase family protein, partial [Longimicrobium sp.]|nr:prolipoprotein diacylglyceryl transferase family protein [Longimicrobium sp.]